MKYIIAFVLLTMAGIVNSASKNDPIKFPSSDGYIPTIGVVAMMSGQYKACGEIFYNIGYPTKSIYFSKQNRLRVNKVMSLNLKNDAFILFHSLARDSYDTARKGPLGMLVNYCDNIYNR